ncbi:L-threonylcarbamoyladenylate synthase [Chlamydia sp. 17-3921]|uniref:L-threonylcarbamoyladenylate synthase n=1 Tax=Chlamydia sp. 17-3921 TaxID=2675798 RepID=UPI00191AF1E2|nr:L-threonylcarbamoyladenylate synthase [Chlamydia sp. 17-3921]
MSRAYFTTSLKDLIEHIYSEKVVAIPTDTVFGLVCSINSLKAQECLYQIKNRNKNKNLAVYANSLEAIESLTLRSLNDKELKLIESFLPGPLSLVVKNNNLSYPQETLTFRIINHPIVQSLIEACGPIVGTSANISNKPPALSAEEVFEDFSSEDLCVFDGVCFKGLESTVVAADPLVLYREGLIPCSLIETRLQTLALRSCTTQHSFSKRITIQTILNTKDLRNFLDLHQKYQGLICENPEPKNFFPTLRKALQLGSPSALFIYNPQTSIYPELSPYLSPYIIKELVGPL